LQTDTESLTESSWS